MNRLCLLFCVAGLTACSDSTDPSVDAAPRPLAGPRGLAACPTLNPLDPLPVTGPGPAACRATVASAGRRFLGAVYTAEADCMDRFQRGDIEAEGGNRQLEPAVRACVGMRELTTGERRPPGDPATAAALDAAEAELAASLAAGCTGEDIGALQLCATTVDGVANCLVADHWEHAQHLLEQTHGEIATPARREALACQQSIAGAVDEALGALLAVTADCVINAVTGHDRCLGAVAEGSLVYPARGAAAAGMASATAALQEVVQASCPAEVLAQLDTCGENPAGTASCLACTVNREAILVSGALFGGVPRAPAERFIDWSALKNPIHGLPDGRFKDQAMGYRDGAFYLLVGPVYEDRVENLHYRSTDLRNWEPYPDTMGPDGRFPGSINLTTPGDIDGVWHAVFQTRGPGHPDQSRIYRSTSVDLVNWEPGVEVGPGLLPGESTIDGAIFRKAGYYNVVMKWRDPQLPMVTRSLTTELDQNWLPAEQMELQAPADTLGLGPGWAENFQLIGIDGRIRLVATARDPEGYRCPNQYTCSHEPFIYQLAEGDGSAFKHWLKWDHKTHLRVPYEAWNPVMHANTGFINDWREYDGFFYLTYAGSLDSDSFDGRGQGKIGIARSRDLVHWRVAGDPRD